MASKKFILPLVCLTVTIFALAGCGSDSSNPVAPIDTTSPALPVGLNAKFSPQQQVVEIAWDANVTDRDLAGYLVYRSTNYLEPVALVSVPQAATSYQDTSINDRASVLTYYVYAVDTRNNLSAAATTVVRLTSVDDRGQINIEMPN